LSVRHRNCRCRGPRTFVHYDITWTAPYANAIYTLMSYDPSEYYGTVDPIKTVRSNQTMRGTIGYMTRDNGRSVSSWDDRKATGTKVFIVVAMVPTDDGSSYVYYASDPLTYTF
jgi:hypothetical protein